MTHFWLTRRQQAVEYEEKGIEGQALEALLKETAPARHAGRVEFARRAAVQYVCGALGLDAETLGPLDAGLYSTALAHLDSFGPGGRLGVQGAATVRHPAFSGCGKGRKAASDGEAWTAAIQELAQSEWVEFSAVGVGGLIRAETVDQGNGTFSLLVDGPIAPREWRLSLAREGLRRAAGLEGWFPAVSMIAGPDTLAAWARVVNALAAEGEEGERDQEAESEAQEEPAESEEDLAESADEAEAEPQAEPQEPQSEPQEAPAEVAFNYRKEDRWFQQEAEAATCQPGDPVGFEAVQERIRQALTIRLTAHDVLAAGVRVEAAREAASSLVRRGEGRWIVPDQEMEVAVLALDRCEDRWNVAVAAYEDRGEDCLDQGKTAEDLLDERIRAAAAIRLKWADFDGVGFDRCQARPMILDWLRHDLARWRNETIRRQGGEPVPEAEDWLEVRTSLVECYPDAMTVARAAVRARGDAALVSTMAESVLDSTTAELNERIQAAGAVRLTPEDMDLELEEATSSYMLTNWVYTGVARHVNADGIAATAVSSTALVGAANKSWKAAARAAVRARGDAALISRAEWRSLLDTAAVSR